jgi:hydroxyacylglutathione hydrolase
MFPCLEDNYAFLVRDHASGDVMTVDTPDADAIWEVLERRGWPLTYIVNTHWHEDHVGGNLALKARTGARVIAPAIETARIPGIDIATEDGATISLGSLTVRAMATGGHTLGHMSFYLPDLDAVFVGDTMFVMGCGRIFEGTPGMMWHSLQKLAALPECTQVYCAHEYSAANARFALSVDQGDATVERANEIFSLRNLGVPTVPTTIGLERRTNPFLHLSTLVEDDGDDSAVARFAELRKAKDRF